MVTGQVFWPKHEDVNKILKVECTPILGDIQYPTIFAISLPVAPGNVLFILQRDIAITSNDGTNVHKLCNFLIFHGLHFFCACMCILLAVIALF